MTDLHIQRRLTNFAKRDAFEKLWLLPAWLALGVASLAIACLDFRRIMPILGVPCETGKPSVAINARQAARAMQVGSTVKLAARFAPWWSDCYPQAIVARWLLGIYRLPFTLSMGVKRDSETGEMLAHAWVESGDTSVCGGKGDEEYRVIASFTNRTRSSLDN